MQTYFDPTRWNMEDDYNIGEYLSNHRMDLPQILNLSLDDQTKDY